MTINNNPRVRLVLRIQPEDGSAAFEAEKAMTVPRVGIPRAGDAYPVWYDPQNPSRLGIGTGLQPAPASPPAPEISGTITPVPVKQDWVNELGRLNDLRMSGALTDEEFAQAKEKLLAAGAR